MRRQTIVADETANAPVDGSEAADAVVVAMEFAVSSGERGVDDNAETAWTQKVVRDDQLS
ncbi:MAG: uncharacterized protein KVP18_001220 [Porospora cf. gigantea A]|uniref:uncharacterized protein n=1 Tax=Porospora cf. gigantea A TaxID=2853593 RepID=UPI00355AA6DF|nr:MAG: hypothetical protein KVP18_001220 [Porospora cf. gigantea A]